MHRNGSAQYFWILPVTVTNKYPLSPRGVQLQASALNVTICPGSILGVRFHLFDYGYSPFCLLSLRAQTTLRARCAPSTRGYAAASSNDHFCAIFISVDIVVMLSWPRFALLDYRCSFLLHSGQTTVKHISMAFFRYQTAPRGS